MQLREVEKIPTIWLIVFAFLGFLGMYWSSALDSHDLFKISAEINDVNVVYESGPGSRKLKRRHYKPHLRYIEFKLTGHEETFTYQDNHQDLRLAAKKIQIGAKAEISFFKSQLCTIELTELTIGGAKIQTRESAKSARDASALWSGAVAPIALLLLALQRLSKYLRSYHRNRNT